MLWVCFGLFLAYFVGFELYWGLARYPGIMAAIADGRTKKTSLYIRMMTGLWIPAGLVLALLALRQVSPVELGLNGFRLHGNRWFVGVAAAVAGLYLAYLVYCLIVLRRNAIKKIKLDQPLPDTVRILLPATPREKRVWICTALTAGFAEELLFRGFLFYLLGALLPQLPPVAVVGISSVVFGVGHAYQGAAEALKPLVLGVVYGVFYLAFGTLLPCIVLHALQDLSATDILND